MKKIIAFFAAVLMVSSLAACAGSGQESESGSQTESSRAEITTVAQTEATTTQVADQGDPTPIDKGWIKLDMPAGYIDDSTSEYVSLICEADKNKMINIARDMLPGVTLDVLVDDQVAQSGGSLGETINAAGYEWKVVNLVSNGKDSRRLFAQLDDMFYARVNLFDLTEQDETARQVLDSLVIDNSQ